MTDEVLFRKITVLPHKHLIRRGHTAMRHLPLKGKANLSAVAVGLTELELLGLIVPASGRRFVIA